MYTLWKLGDDSFTFKIGRNVVVAEKTYEEVIRAMLLVAGIAGTEIMKAQADMEMSGSNLAIFGPDKQVFAVEKIDILN